MKKILVVLVALLCLTTSAFADPWRVFDNADLFTDAEVSEIEQSIFAFQRETNIDFAVLTTDDYLGTENWKAIADSFYDSEDLGFGRNASGLLYYIDMNQRVPYVLTSGATVNVFDSNAIAKAHDVCFGSLAEGKYMEAVIKMIDAATEAFK